MNQVMSRSDRIRRVFKVSLVVVLVAVVSTLFVGDVISKFALLFAVVITLLLTLVCAIIWYLDKKRATTNAKEGLSWNPGDER